MAKTVYREDSSVRELAEKVISKYPELADCVDANIVYLIKISTKTKYIGKCVLASEKWRFLTNADLVVEVWEPFWREFPQAREALLYHELRHVRKKVKEREGSVEVSWGLHKHELELFLDEVRLFGFWNESLKKLKGIIDVCQTQD